MRARTPDAEGHVVVGGGVRIGWERFGDDGPTILFLPPWAIVSSRVWKAQVAHLARRHRLVLFDGAGNGRSDQPLDPDAYRTSTIVDAALAVLDATATDAAVVVSLSDGPRASLELAQRAPARVRGQVLIAPGTAVLVRDALQVDTAGLSGPLWQHVPDEMTGDYGRYLEGFFAAAFPEPHSTKQREDGVGWGHQTSAEVLLTDMAGMVHDTDLPTTLAWCAAVTTPSVVVHGTDDRIVPYELGVRLAEALDAPLVTLEGAGHVPNGRDPVLVNRLIERFVADLGPEPRPAADPPTVGGPRAGNATAHLRWTRAPRRRPRVLYLSSPIGLGHARRDLAIVRELRDLHPDLEVDWLSQAPVTDVLVAAGEHVHPASRWLLSESAHFIAGAHGHGLNAFRALRDMDEVLLANFLLFQEVVDEGTYDLVVGDEAWDVDHYWHEHPELKRGAHAWLTDFVGFVPMPGGGDEEAALTSDHNAEMLDHVARFPRVRDRSVFVGNPEDVVDEVFGPDLPRIGDWTSEHFDFAGYVTGFVPPSPDEAAAWRQELGYRADERVCIVTVGGSGVGGDVLHRAIEALPLVRHHVPELRMVLVAGPRIDASSFPQRDGLDVRGYVPDLHRHLSVCDVAVVQGGLTTTMELTAAKRPFVYFPLRDHFEQRVHVRHRLDRHRAGRCMDLATSDADALAAELLAALDAPVDYRDVETDGANRAAVLLGELL